MRLRLSSLEFGFRFRGPERSLAATTATASREKGSCDHAKETENLDLVLHSVGLILPAPWRLWPAAYPALVAVYGSPVPQCRDFILEGQMTFQKIAALCLVALAVGGAALAQVPA